MIGTAGSAQPGSRGIKMRFLICVQMQKTAATMAAISTGQSQSNEKKHTRQLLPDACAFR